MFMCDGAVKQLNHVIVGQDNTRWDLFMSFSKLPALQLQILYLGPFPTE